MYNIKTRASRKTKIAPSRTWGGPGVLGVVCRFDAALPSDHFFAVGEVGDEGPAFEAGLRPGDYLLGGEEEGVHSDTDVWLLTLPHTNLASDM